MDRFELARQMRTAGDVACDAVQAGAVLWMAYAAIRGAQGGYDAIEDFFTGEGLVTVAMDSARGASGVVGVATGAFALLLVDSSRRIIRAGPIPPDQG